MTVAVFVANESDAACLIPWGVHFASSNHTELLVVCPKKSKGKRGWDPLEKSEKDTSVLYQSVFDILEHQDSEKVVLKQAIGDGSESSDMDRTLIVTKELIAPNPEQAFVEEIEKLNVTLLLLPAFEHVKGAKDGDALWTQQLVKDAPCQVAIVRGCPPECKEPSRILVACHGQQSDDDIVALDCGCKLAKGVEDGGVTLLYVRPDDDEVARHIGEEHLKQLTKSISDKPPNLKAKVVLADSFQAGICQEDLTEYDLVITGTRNPKTIRTVLRDVGISDDGPLTCVATIRKAVPLTDRVWSKLKHAVRSKVPQMERENRVALVDRLQTSSQFDFDFIALMSLSTLIAALGLARNSGAVVIGAMLVAPLMTPLVAMGFALVQGNEKLIRSALRSVVLGFTVALGIGAFVGILLHVFSPSFEISSQMLDRGFPNLLDLVVALASGVAGAYALGRPNLISALPGVAIAAALVPPIATSGLALTMGNLTLSGGACLLFLTNIIAIVLGTAVTFWAVGISTRKVSDEKKSAQMWPRYWFLGFVILSFLLAAVMSYMNPLVKPEKTSDKQTPKASHSQKGNTGALLDIE